MLSINFMILLLVHLRDDLIFLQCIDCEDGKLCLAEQPAIECRLGDWEWSAWTLESLERMVTRHIILGLSHK
eukprot:g3346.t1